MRSYTDSHLILLLGIILAGCSYSPNMKFFDPQIGATYKSEEALSNLKMIMPEKESFISNRFAFVIARNSSINSEREDYLLICPIDLLQNSDKIQLKDLSLHKSVYFNREKLIEFNGVLKRMIINWDEEIGTDEMICYSYNMYEEKSYIKSKEIGWQGSKANIETKYEYELTLEYQKYYTKKSLSNNDALERVFFITGRYIEPLTIYDIETILELEKILEKALDELPEETIPEEIDKVETMKAKI
ncbi:MAG: hypothetical protein K9M99_03710 [Candidatus Cloacimonetes bacterium]|nr:hypothetical protein [Candidatus Cloacimonadota bacterium]